MKSDPVVFAKGLSKHFKSVEALTDFDCEIDRGEVVGLLGPNGSGKSTLVRLLLGFLNPTKGNAQILGLDCTQDRVQVHQNVAYLPGDARLFRTMRGFDVLKFFGSIRTNSNMQRAEEIANRIDLDLSRWVAFMSTGMRQKLALAAVLAQDTPILILDEPTANLDPTVRNEVLKFVLTAKQEGKTVIFSSHVLSEIEEVCDRVLILRGGKLIHEQRLDTLYQQHQISASYAAGKPRLREDLRDRLNIHFESVDENQPNGKLTAVVDSELLPDVLNWLATCELEQVRVQPVDLRTVYDRFHQAKA